MNRRKLKWIHHIHAVTIGFLLFSGISLFVPFLRTLFVTWKIPLVAIHFWVAIFYIAVILFSIINAFHYYKKRAPIELA